MKTKKLLFIIPILFVVVIVAAFGYIYSYVSKWEDRIYPKSYIGNTEVSGLTKVEAKTLIDSSNKSLLNTKLQVVYDQKEYNITYSDMQINLDIDNSINSALQYGKNLSLLKKFSALRSANENKHSIELTYNQEFVKQFVEKVKKDINSPSVNAYVTKIDKGIPVIVKEVIGKKIDEGKLYNDIINNISYSGSENIKIETVVMEDKPAITEGKLKEINSLISTMTTHYSTANVGRAENIAIAAAKLNGKLLMPGEEFSFNKETGARTLDMGFKGAPVIVKGKLVDGVAGGVCQVSTTLYNAVSKMGIKSLERKNHSLAPAYIEPGYDATVSENIDYKFKNTLNYPLYIESKAAKGRVTFNIYSNSSLSEIKYKLENEVIEVLEPQVTYNTISTIPRGAVEKVQDATRGYKVKVYLVAYKNGKIISKELLSKDNYKKIDGIYNIGL